MKYWLIFMIFSDDGEYIRMKEIPVESRKECEREAGRQATRMVNRGYLTQSWCVTNSHYHGQKRDRGIPPYLNVIFNF